MSFCLKEREREREREICKGVARKLAKPPNEWGRHPRKHKMMHFFFSMHMPYNEWAVPSTHETK